MSVSLTKILKTPLHRYIAVGGAVYTAELFCIYMFQKFSANDTLAVAVSFWIGLVLSFVLQKIFTFGDKRVGGKLVATQFLAVTLLVLFNFGFTILASQLLASLLPIYITRTLALGLTTMWNFYLYKTRIFGPKGSLPPIE